MHPDDYYKRCRELRKLSVAKKLEISKVETELLTIQKQIPNMSHPDAPIGYRLRGKEAIYVAKS